MNIIGAGLSGLLAATQFQTATVLEAMPEHRVAHRALLRFRSSAVGDAVGIEFRKVRVHKGVWFDGEYVAPNIQLSNLYSHKVLSRYSDRSIWNLEPVDRWVAPDDLLEQLVERVGKRIQWGSAWTVPAEGISRDSPPVISTMPMSVLVKQLALKDHPAFHYASITVTRFRLAQSDVFQTVYFPSPSTRVYRASITGDLMIVESTAAPSDDELYDVFEAFGISLVIGDRLDQQEQSFGKIAPVDDAWRRKFITEATRRLNVYSLGRFAVWRNILADDVLRDIAVIKRLLKGDAYAAQLHGAGQ